MCFTVITATMEIQKEQCAAEYHWQLRAPAITAKNALDDIEFFCTQQMKLLSSLGSFLQSSACKWNRPEEHKQVTV